MYLVNPQTGLSLHDFLQREEEEEGRGKDNTV
jgi:hypothetical protein